jgi:hypothetical protein
MVQTRPPGDNVTGDNMHPFIAHKRDANLPKAYPTRGDLNLSLVECNVAYLVPAA